MIDGIDRNTLFQEIHRAIEESATSAARSIMTGKINLTYPPNGGLSPAEAAALVRLACDEVLESALRKVIAHACSWPIFHLFCLVDGVVDAPRFDPGPQTDEMEDGFLHDDFHATYWAWHERRPDPGWRLDTYDPD